MNKIKDDQGSFTIEASLLLPVILFITMLLLFFCLYSYQQSMLLQVGSTAAERVAYNWDNSHKEETTGAFQAGEYDSLYWRIGDDALLSSLFGKGSDSGAVTVQFPAESDAAGGLPERKLTKFSGLIPTSMPGEMGYSHGISGRKAKGQLEHILNLPVLEDWLADKGNPNVRTQSIIAEPVEFIRTVNLTRYYGEKFKGGSKASQTGVAMEKKDAGAMMVKLHGK